LTVDELYVNIKVQYRRVIVMLSELAWTLTKLDKYNGVSINNEDTELIELVKGVLNGLKIDYTVYPSPFIEGKVQITIHE
jgi:hypothetical protein